VDNCKIFRIIKKEIVIDDDDDDDNEDDENNNKNKNNKRKKKLKQKKVTNIQMSHHVVENFFTQLVEKEKDFFSITFNHNQSEENTFIHTFSSSFFINVIPVTPSKFRPASFVNGQAFENQRNSVLSKLIQLNQLFFNAVQENNNKLSNNNNNSNSSSSTDIILTDDNPDNPDNINNSSLTDIQMNIQIFLNIIYSSYLAPQHYRLLTDSSLPFSLVGTLNSIFRSIPTFSSSKGIKELVERKHGLFRNNMMGKRVNFSARSVISPDPSILTCEIGIPRVFAEKLYVGESVNNYNENFLKQLIINGTSRYPGAYYIDDDNGNLIDLARLDEKHRHALAENLTSSNYSVEKSRNTDHGFFHSSSTAVQREFFKQTDLSLRSLPGGTLNPSFSCIGKFPQKVYRNLIDGDVVIMNRQPTLHRPSMMAHKVRVIEGQKTIRMHYSNCSTYNADYDGDEMNVHFLQSNGSRSEAYNLMFSDKNYFSPTNGNPLRGLIQDHVDAGILLTMKGSFLTKEIFMNLVYSACYVLGGEEVKNGISYETVLLKFFAVFFICYFICCLSSNFLDSGNIVFKQSSIPRIFIPRPAVLKPVVLYTGKQIITTILNYITLILNYDSYRKSSFLPYPPINLLSPSKISAKNWACLSTGSFQPNAEEGLVYILNNNLIHGVLEKSQYGASSFGLVHTVYELYGSLMAGKLLSAFGILFSGFLQRVNGFTCGLKDMVLLENFDVYREKVLKEKNFKLFNVYYDFLGREKLMNKFSLNNNGNYISGSETFYPHLTSPREFKAFLSSSLQNTSFEAELDSVVKTHNYDVTSSVIKECIPNGQLVPFPENCFSLMTISGAKGSQVNFSHISCLLGQQELEGHRPPITSAGRFLPCFPPYSLLGRAGGFIMDRYLTGLRPAEYFFHAMAGREGLIDTAVKTSRSGYLQHCIIKGLENVYIAYDGTVRQVGNGPTQTNEELFGRKNSAMLWNSLRNRVTGEEDIGFHVKSKITKKRIKIDDSVLENDDLTINKNKNYSTYPYRTSNNDLKDNEDVEKYSIDSNIDLEETQGGNIIQFLYGEDGLDVTKIKMMEQFKFWLLNRDILLRKRNIILSDMENTPHLSDPSKENNKSSFHMVLYVGDKLIDRLCQTCKSGDFIGDPIITEYSPHSNLGSVSERYLDNLLKFITSNEDYKLLKDVGRDNTEIEKWKEDNNYDNKFSKNISLYSSLGSKEKSALDIFYNCNIHNNLSFFIPDTPDSNQSPISPSLFFSLCLQQYQRNLITPNEAVGILAAQSIGEPSTQMTLNTFHLAGHGGINVTLGIPRLKEILLSGSKGIKTPSMELPLLDWRKMLEISQRIVMDNESKQIALKLELQELFRSVNLNPERVDFGKLFLEDEKIKNINKYMADCVIKEFQRTSFINVLTELDVVETFGAKNRLRDYFDKWNDKKLTVVDLDAKNNSEGSHAVLITFKLISVKDLREKFSLSLDSLELRRILDRDIFVTLKKLPKLLRLFGFSSSSKKSGKKKEDKIEKDSENSEVEVESNENLELSDQMEDGIGRRKLKKKRSKKRVDENSFTEDFEGVKEENRTKIHHEEGEDVESDDNENLEDDDDVEENAKEFSKIKNDEEDDSEGDSDEDSDNNENNDNDNNGNGENENVDDSENDEIKVEKTSKSFNKHDQISSSTSLSEFNDDDYCHSFVSVIFLPSDTSSESLLFAIKQLISSINIRKVEGIKRLVYHDSSEEKGSDGKPKNKPFIRVEGINFMSIIKSETCRRLIDLDGIKSNNIYDMLITYGVECCRKSIIQEIEGVFRPYGIDVNKRHLYLIADWMTFGGSYSSFNRRGIGSPISNPYFSSKKYPFTQMHPHFPNLSASLSSPFLRISFETSMGFLGKSSLLGENDEEFSPSTSFIIGRPPNVGTGRVVVTHNLNKEIDYLNERLNLSKYENMEDDIFINDTDDDKTDTESELYSHNHSDIRNLYKEKSRRDSEMNENSNDFSENSEEVSSDESSEIDYTDEEDG
jgi:DNA-directed RNA polymerase beta' subunit